MKTFVQVLLVAACFVACARGFPSLGFDTSDETDYEDPGFSSFSNYFTDFFNRIRQMSHSLNPWGFSGGDFKIPEGANTTSTTKIINGHVVTINETTYNTGDQNSNVAFRIRTVDIKPLNGTNVAEGSTFEPDTEPKVSAETVEEFNNEIPKNADTLTA